MPELFIEPEDYAYIQAAVKKASFREVGGFGVVEIIDGRPTVRHMRLLEQTVSSGEVEWSDDAFADYLEWLYRPVESGGAGFTSDAYGAYSWHSHGNMSVFWSQTDEDFIQKMGKTMPWMFSSVWNTKGEVKHRLDLFSGMDAICPVLGGDNPHVWWDKGDLTVLPVPDTDPVVEIIEGIELEFDARIEELEAQIEAVKAEKKETTKELRDTLAGLYEERKLVGEARMEEDWKENVSTYSYSSTSRPQIGSGAGSSGSSGPSTSKGKGGKKGNADAATESDRGPHDVVDPTAAQGFFFGGGVAGKDVDLTHERWQLKVWVRVYDMTNNIVCRVSLAEILSDMNLVVLQQINEDVLAALTEGERNSLAIRVQYNDIETEVSYGLYADGWFAGGLY